MYILQFFCKLFKFRIFLYFSTVGQNYLSLLPDIEAGIFEYFLKQDKSASTMIIGNLYTNYLQNR